MKNNRQASTYESMHKKLKRVRGTARSFPCQHCERQATDWALSPDAKDIRIQVGTNEAGRAFSIYVEDYLHLCRRCHSKQDTAFGLMKAPTGNHSLRPKNHCSVEDCSGPYKAKGLCTKHYAAERRKK